MRTFWYGKDTLFKLKTAKFEEYNIMAFNSPFYQAFTFNIHQHRKNVLQVLKYPD